jgi:hypothetical protein
VETSPTFIESTVCRIPSLAFAIARCGNQSYEQYHRPTVDLSKSTYVLDPESDLPETRRRMQMFFNKLSSDNALNWNGFTGEIPHDDIIKATLTRAHSLFFFAAMEWAKVFFPAQYSKASFLTVLLGTRN